MDWTSFSLGFLAFPVVAAAVLGVYLGLTRVTQRDATLAKLGVAQRSSALDFSPRLIGEIGEDTPDTAILEAEPTAKAS